MQLTSLYSPVVVAGKKNRNAGKGKRTTRKGKGKGSEKQALSPLMNMSKFRGKETLMFEPVAGGRDDMQVVYAYPNEYSVGITSLGYQSVW